MVNQAAGRETRSDQKTKASLCTNCGTANAPYVCSLCKKTQYCSKECQTEHWKQGGHKKQCKEWRSEQATSIMLERPTEDGMFHSLISTRPNSHLSTSGANSATSGYKKPSSVAVHQRFDLKIQGNGPNAPLMVYDKTRECNFMVSPGTRGFQELWQAVKAEPTWQGRKTFVEASFDANGNCIVYPGMTSVKKW